MPRLTKNEWTLVKYACRHLRDSLDISNGEIKDRLPEVYKQNVKDIETLERIMQKVNRGKL